MEALNGYKTYIFSGLLIVSALLFAFGVIDKETFMTLATIFGGGGLISGRIALKKVEKVAPKPKQ